MANLTRVLLPELLNARGIKPNAYCLTGGHPSESYCIDCDGTDWIVYYSERGLRSGLERFETEADACLRLLEILLADKTTHR